MLCQFRYENANENEAHFVLLECPIYKLQWSLGLLETILEIGSLKSSFQSDPQDDISLYLTGASALHYPREFGPS
jgi:hypothetical protein